MKFKINEISPSRKEIRISLNPVNVELDSGNNINYYIFGHHGGNFDMGSMSEQYIPLQSSKYFTIGPNPAIIRLAVAFLKDTLGSINGFKDVTLETQYGSSKVINIAIDDISLINLDSQSTPTMVVKLLSPLSVGAEVNGICTISRTVIDAQEQEVYYISSEEEPAVVRSLVPDYDLKEEIGNSQTAEKELQNYNELTQSSAHEDLSIIHEITSGSDLNFKQDFSDFKNHVHFGSAVSKLENFDYKVKQIEDQLFLLSQSFATSSTVVVESYRKNIFSNIQSIQDEFTPYEKELYYKSDLLTPQSPPGLGGNFINQKPIDGNYTKLTNVEGFGSVYLTSGSSASDSKISLFSSKYNVEDKPFYNYSSSLYLSFMMRGDETINGSGGQIVYKNTNEQHLPKLPYDTLFSSSISQPTIKSESWQRYIYHASMSYFAPHSSNPTVGYVGSITDFTKNSSEINVINSSDKTGSYPITLGSRYTNLATNITGSGNSFTGSILPAGELFHIYIDTAGTAITSSYITDIKITKNNPVNALPFGQMYSTGSSEYLSWYGTQMTSASNYDESNPHNLIKTLPGFIQGDNTVDNTILRKFVNMMGESFDLTKNYIEGFTSLINTQYGTTGEIPDNLLPIVAKSKNWEFELPFSNSEEASLLNFMGSTLSNVNINYNVKNNIFRNLINNVKYIYKTKGTENSIRALLNSYGFPPDILKIKEHGASIGKTEDSIVDDNISNIQGGLGAQTGSFSFNQIQDTITTYNIDTNHRPIKAEWGRDDVDGEVVEFIFEGSKGNNTQQILASSGSAGKVLWDIVLQPSASDNVRGRLQFRINNTQNAGSTIETAANRVSMSTDYFDFKNQNRWNVMLQRTSGPSGSFNNVSATSELITSHSYELYVGEQKLDKLRVFSAVSMSFGGTHYSESAANFVGTGSRPKNDSGNLVIGGNGGAMRMTGSIGEFRVWKHPLSASKFKQHVFDKKSTVGNHITGSQVDLIYHFKLNENHYSGSMSTTPKIIDSNSQNIKDYSITITEPQLGHSPLYDTNHFDRIQFNVGIGAAYSPSENNILIDPEKRFIGNLHPSKPSFMSVYDPLINKRKASTVLEMTRSPQEVINNFILNQLGNFDFNDLFADPRDINKPNYQELEDFADKFLNYYNVSLDINKFIEAQANIFNKSLINALKKLVPARAQFSKLGVEVKPTFFDRQKIQNNKIEKEILNFEGNIPFNNWDTNEWSFRELDYLYPADTNKEGVIQISTASGSIAKEFTKLEPLYSYNPVGIALSSATGSLAWDFAKLPKNYEYLNFDIQTSHASGSDSFNFEEYEPLHKSHDFRLFNVNSDTINSDSEFNIFNLTNENYQTHNINFRVASSTGSISKNFTKLESLPFQGEVGIALSSASGSIVSEFSKNEPLHKSHDFDFFSLKDNFNTDDSDSINLTNETIIPHAVTIPISSPTGSQYVEFTKLEKIYTSLDNSIALSTSSGSLGWNLISGEKYYENREFDIFNINNHFNNNSDDNLITFTNETIEKYDSNISIASSTGSISWDFTKLEPLHQTKDSHIVIASNSGSKINLTEEYVPPKLWEIPVASNSGSSINLTEEYVPSKNSEIVIASNSGSVLNIMEEYVPYKNINIPIASNSGSVLNLAKEYVPTKNSQIVIASNSGSVLNLTKEYIPTRDSHIVIASNSGSVLNLTKEYYSTNDINIPIASHTGSKMNLTSENQTSKDTLIEIVDRQEKNEIIDFRTESYIQRLKDSLNQYVNTDLNTVYDMTASKDNTTHKLDYNTNVNYTNQSDTGSSDIQFTNEYSEPYTPHLKISSTTGSLGSTRISSSVLVPIDAPLDFQGNDSFYEHTHKSYVNPLKDWGAGADTGRDIRYLHMGLLGKNLDYNTYHFEGRDIFYSIGDVETISGSNASISSSFDTDFDGTLNGTQFTASKDFSNQQFVKLNEFLGIRPMGTTNEFLPSSSIDFGGGKFLDDVMVYPSNHQFVIGSSRDCIDRLTYSGTQNNGGDVIESQAYTDLDTNAYYFVLTTGGTSVIVQ